MGRQYHGDDWIEILGGLLVALVAFAWSLVVLVIRLFQWGYRRFKNRPSARKIR